MSDRELYCQYCNCYLGTIRDGTLKKGIQFSCTVCSEQEKKYIREDDDAVEKLKKVFGMR